MSRLFSFFLAAACLSIVVLSVAFAGCGTSPDAPGLFGGPEGGLVEGGNACTGSACGANCATKCAVGAMCMINQDCSSANCMTGSCKPPATCSDGIKNGEESDIDCGGTCPNKCAQGSACNTGPDCTTGHCEANRCDVPSCADGAKDGDETDTDCGGSCTKCSPGKACAVVADCDSAICTNKLCVAPSCMDKIQNGGESDVDCGGTCPQCALSKDCKGSGDCTSGLCSGVCVACLKGTDCPNRICTNTACITPSVIPPSCGAGLATCGAASNDNCCASDPVTGGTFNRSFDGTNFTDATNPATVSTFHLDRYEVTVGRFRNFVAGYPANQPDGGSGGNASNNADPGWDPNFTALLPATAALLTGSFQTACPGQATWTDTPGANESLPINCLTWYVAYAFCIYDQGRLPTEAEWNYAAAGGTQQRIYPWANTIPVSPAQAVYGANTYSKVGSLAAGASLYGQLDMAGNVWEWTLDYYPPTVAPAAPVYPMPCADCANLVLSPTRTIRGGIQNPLAADLSPPAVPNVLMNGNRGSVDPANQAFDDGVRCARK